jgi:hypothetical protein
VIGVLVRGEQPRDSWRKGIKGVGRTGPQVVIGQPRVNEYAQPAALQDETRLAEPADADTSA